MPRRTLPSKLFSLKDWLTLDDTARYLSIAFGEEVTRADVLRLALDKRLVISVDFVNHATVKRGRIIPLEECPMKIVQSLNSTWKDKPLVVKRELFPADLPKLKKEIRDGLQNGELALLPGAIFFRPGEFLLLEDKISSIDGVWDLPLVAGEALDIEHLYQMETGGPEVTLTNLEGAFVERGGVVCQLQTDMEDNEYSTGSKANGAMLEEKIHRDDIPNEKAADLRARYVEQRKKFLEGRRTDRRELHYFPAGGLPEDAVHVVRTTAIREFEQSVLSVVSDTETKISQREQKTLLNIVGGLLNLLLGKTPAGKSQSVFNNQSSVIDALLAAHEGKPGIATRTLQEKFAAAKRALES